LPTPSAPVFVSTRTRLWTLKPVCRQARIRSAHSGPRSPPADEKRQDLAGEDVGQPRVVNPRDLMENSRLVHPALRHQKMQMGMEIETIPKGLEDGDDARLEIRAVL
jgi:hypothetical protein